MITESNIFDLRNIFINELAGNLFLFVIISLILIFYFATKYNVPYQASVMLSAIFLLIMFAGFSDALIMVWVFIVIAIFGSGYLLYSRFIRRG